MPEEKNLPLPEKELLPPHDMQLGPGQGIGTNIPPPANPTPHNSTAMAGFWGKYGFKKWLLPLIIIILVVVVGAAAFMSSSDNTMTRREKRMERQEKRQQKQNKNKKQNSKNKKKRNKNNNKARGSADMASFTYGSGDNKISLQYPSNMRANISEDTSILGENNVPLITFSGNGSLLRMTIEPNANNLSASAWQTNLGQANKLYNTPTETLTASGKPAVIQHTLGQTANWVAYVPMSGKMLLISMNYAGGKNKAKDDFVAMLKTLRIGGTPSSPLPTGPMPTLPIQQ